jgi:hypothetical protein
MDLFSSPIGRLAFLGRHVLSFILVVLGMMILVVADQDESVILMLLSCVPMLLGIGYYVLYAALPRLASIGLSGWFASVLLVPVANVLFYLFLLFCPAGWLIKHDEVA